MRYRQADKAHQGRQERHNAQRRHHTQEQAAKRATVIAMALSDDLLRLSPTLLIRDIRAAFGVSRSTAQAAVHIRVAGLASEVR
jgi:hypothetical protein